MEETSLVLKVERQHCDTVWSVTACKVEQLSRNNGSLYTKTKKK